MCTELSPACRVTLEFATLGITVEDHFTVEEYVEGSTYEGSVQTSRALEQIGAEILEQVQAGRQFSHLMQTAKVINQLKMYWTCF